MAIKPFPRIIRPVKNEESWQARGLTAWYPLIHDAHDYAGELSLPVGSGAPGVVTDVEMGRRMNFNSATPDYFRRTGAPNQQVYAYPCSVSLWLRPDSVSIGYQDVVNMANSHWLRIVANIPAGGDIMTSVRGLSNYTNEYKVVGALSVGTWTHVVAAWTDGQNGTIFADGVEGAQFTVPAGDPGFPSTTNSAIGVYAGSAVNPFDGAIKDVRFYKYAMTATQAQKLFEDPWDLYLPEEA